MTRYFQSDDLRIAFDDLGEGEPIVLLHGFSASRRLNRQLTAWCGILREARYRVIAPDARGHRQSDKPTEVDAYRPEGIAGDTVRLLDHLGIRLDSALWCRRRRA